MSETTSIRRRKVVDLPLSPKGTAALQQAETAWEAAMATLPEGQRVRMNLHQLASIPALDFEVSSRFKDARARLKAEDGDPIHHTFRYVDGAVVHSYYVYR